jgi:hypothetical protein
MVQLMIKMLRRRMFVPLWCVLVVVGSFGMAGTQRRRQRVRRIS